MIITTTALLPLIASILPLSISLALPHTTYLHKVEAPNYRIITEAHPLPHWRLSPLSTICHKASPDAYVLVSSIYNPMT